MARHSRLHTLTTMKQVGMVPLFYSAAVDTARGVMQACHDAGALVLEFTNRGDRAFEVFRELAAHRDRELPQMVLGAGSVANAATAGLYMSLGADFVVSPLLDPDTARTCNSQKVPYLPGCGSVSEIHQAHLLGVEICKVFPAGQVGGPGFVKAVKAPCPWAELMPTGGVTPTRDNLAAWFDAGVACVGMGSQLVSSELMKSRDFATLKANVADALKLIGELRHASGSGS